MLDDGPDDRAGEILPGGEVWVFAYGSLMWRPGFAYQDVRRARLVGWHRAFCIVSRHHRGNAAWPGLVLGLDRGGICDGLAYKIAPAAARGVLEYLREREQVSGVYREALATVTLDEDDGDGDDGDGNDGRGVRREVRALAYFAERAHPGYVTPPCALSQSRIVARARGLSGSNIDYLVSTLVALRRLGIREPALERVLAGIGPVLVRDYRLRGAKGLGASVRLTPPSQCWASVPRIRPSNLKRFHHRRALPLAFGRGDV